MCALHVLHLASALDASLHLAFEDRRPRGMEMPRVRRIARPLSTSSGPLRAPASRLHQAPCSGSSHTLTPSVCGTPILVLRSPSLDTRTVRTGPRPREHPADLINISIRPE